ncbi:hypothetical protein [Streptomyces lydicus]|uniref:hypothetical protein n=1 Tax=Streptomyces lydicus TaxID=47763 RepID=UPI0013DE0945|nr:hypothetical protein [Streptomyces lydicus]
MPTARRAQDPLVQRLRRPPASPLTGSTTTTTSAPWTGDSGVQAGVFDHLAQRRHGPLDGIRLCAPPERKYSAWIEAANTAATASWTAAEMYEEEGAAAINR